MSNPAPVFDPDAIFDQFFGGGGSGGGGGENWLSTSLSGGGYLASLLYDTNGNQKHTISQNGNPVGALALSAAQNPDGTIGIKSQWGGMLGAGSKAVLLDPSQCPKAGSWAFNQCGVTGLATQNGGTFSVNGTEKGGSFGVVNNVLTITLTDGANNVTRSVNLGGIGNEQFNIMAYIAALLMVVLGAVCLAAFDLIIGIILAIICLLIAIGIFVSFVF